MAQEATTNSSRLWRLCGCSDDITATDRRNGRAVSSWAIVWTVVFLASLATMEAYGDDSLAISATALAAAALATVPLILAYVRFVRQADELTRMIHLQAMAVAFGASFVVAVLERFFERVASLLPAFLQGGPLHFVNPPMVLMVAFTVSLWVLQRRYSR